MVALTVSVSPLMAALSEWSIALFGAGVVLMVVFQAQQIDRKRLFGVLVALAAFSVAVFADGDVPMPNGCDLIEKYSALWWAAGCWWYELAS
jgi:hypothetical protein